VDEIRNRTGRKAAAALAAGFLLLAMGAPAPAQTNVRLPGLSGGQLTGAELARGATVVVVWASWSPRCRDIVERANAVASRWGGRARVVTVDFQEDPAAVEAFLRDKKLAVPVYLDRDGEFSKAHAVTTLPGLVVFQDGAVRYQGKLPADPDATLSQILG
jgi:thiol-disulfide isomerase/thioredoxin